MMNNSYRIKKHNSICRTMWMTLIYKFYYSEALKDGPNGPNIIYRTQSTVSIFSSHIQDTNDEPD